MGWTNSLLLLLSKCCGMSSNARMLIRIKMLPIKHILSRGNKSKGNAESTVPHLRSKRRGHTTKKYKEPHLSCTYYHKTGHNDAKCWKLHSELEPPDFKKKRLNYKCKSCCRQSANTAISTPQTGMYSTN